LLAATFEPIIGLHDTSCPSAPGLLAPRFLYSPRLDYKESVLGCRKFQGSQAYGPGSEVEYLEYRQWFLGINTASGGDRYHDHWLPFSDEVEEGVWRQEETGELGTFTDWGPGQPNGGRSRTAPASGSSTGTGGTTAGAPATPGPASAGGSRASPSSDSGDSAPSPPSTPSTHPRTSGMMVS
jgi:hypothetical protein